VKPYPGSAAPQCGKIRTISKLSITGGAGRMPAPQGQQKVVARIMLYYIFKFDPYTVYRVFYQKGEICI
jgi:hypothetical protein